MRALTLFAVLAFGACAAPEAPPDAVSVARTEFAATPVPLSSSTETPAATVTDAPTTQESPTPDATATEVPGSEPGATASGSPTPDGPTERPTGTSPPDDEPTGDGRGRYAQRARIDDPTGDAGLEGPDYADLERVTLDDDGEWVRLTVVLAAPIPTQLDEGEVVGIGVDLYLFGDQESDYQVFADGGPEGWYAYLHTPDGFVDYPGVFRMGGDTLVFELPWQRVGDPDEGELSAFLDWAREQPVVNLVAEDRAPDEGTAPFTR